LLLGKKREAAFRCSFNPAEIFSALIFVPEDSGGIIRSHKEVFCKKHKKISKNTKKTKKTCVFTSIFI